MTSSVISAPVSANTVRDRAAELSAGFRSRSTISEAERSIPRASIEELVDAGLARLLVPSEHGGVDAGVRDAVDITIEVAKGCASTGWISWLMMHMPSVVAMFPTEAQDAVWAGGPDVVVCGSHLGISVTPVAGGYRISGAGPFTSGVNHADWVYVGGFEPANAGPPTLRYFLLNKSQYAVKDTWDTVGMRGTGSNTVIVDDVFVPAAFTLLHTDAREGTGPGSLTSSSPLTRLPWVAKGSLGFIATILGAAQGAFDDVIATVSAKKTPGGARIADGDAVQIDVGLAAAKLDAAQILLRRLADRADSGRSFTIAERTEQIGMSSFIVGLVLEAIDKVVELSGTSGFATSALAQQAWRDIHFASAHISLSRREPLARYGRSKLDVPEKAPGMFF